MKLYEAFAQPVQRFSFKDPTVEIFTLRRKWKEKLGDIIFAVFLQCKNYFASLINMWISWQIIHTLTVALKQFFLCVTLKFTFYSTHVKKKQNIVLFQAVHISLKCCGIVACSEDIQNSDCIARLNKTKNKEEAIWWLLRVSVVLFSLVWYFWEVLLCLTRVNRYSDINRWTVMLLCWSFHVISIRSVPSLFCKVLYVLPGSHIIEMSKAQLTVNSWLGNRTPWWLSEFFLSQGLGLFRRRRQ